MLISPHEQERLLIHVAAGLARERRARGLKLNYPEAVALITSFLLGIQTGLDGQCAGWIFAMLPARMSALS